MKKGLLLNGFLLIFVIFGSGFKLAENKDLNNVLMTIGSIIAIIWIILTIAIVFKVIQQWKNLF